MQYHPSLAKKLFPITEKTVFPKWLNWLNFLCDIVLILFYSAKNPRFFKGTKLSLILLFAIKQEADFEEKGGDLQKLHKARAQHAKWLYEQLVDLGAAFIKVGQFAATREDLVPKEYVQELGKLQDAAPAMPLETVKEVLTKSLGKPPEEVFEWIEETAIASASIGQVHRAITKEGKQLVLKVQRPNLDNVFLMDISIARAFSVFFERYFKWGKNRYWPEICDEFGKVLFQEIDFYQEALNAERLKLNLNEAHPEVIIPAVHWEFVSKEVLAMDYHPGKKITDLAAIEAAGHSKEWVAQKLLSIFSDQFFKHCFFHADPHPGNLAITPNGQIVLYDFGMTYRIDEKVRGHFQEAILALIGRDADALIESLGQMDLIRPGADLVLLKNLIQKTTYKYYSGGRLQDLQVEEIRDDINKVIANGPIRMAPSLTYLFRTIGILEGLCRSFDPNFNFIAALKPLTKEWLLQSENTGPAQIILSKLAEKLDLKGLDKILDIAKLPGKANNLLSKMESGELKVPIDLKPLQQRIEKIEGITQGIAFMFIGIVLGGSGICAWQLLNLPELVWQSSVGLAAVPLFAGMKKILLGS